MIKNRNSIIFTISNSSKSKISHLGGKPLAPENFTWPVYIDDSSDETHYLSFIAQFDCEELAKYDIESFLPRTGILSFFYDIKGQPWGDEHEDKTRFRVYWFEEADKLIETDFPEDLMEEFCIPHIDLDISSKPSYVSWEDYEIAYGELSPEERDAYFDMYIKLEGEEPEGRNKILGWADVIQDNMTVQCEEMRESDSDYLPAETLGEWQLLLQLSSIEHDDFELLFGDCGKLYFYIKKVDLQNRNFDDVWCILQC